MAARKIIKVIATNRAQDWPCCHRLKVPDLKTAQEEGSVDQSSEETLAVVPNTTC